MYLKYLVAHTVFQKHETLPMIRKIRTRKTNYSYIIFTQHAFQPLLPCNQQQRTTNTVRWIHRPRIGAKSTTDLGKVEVVKYYPVTRGLRSYKT